jgi:hypothetical protein
MGERYQSMGTPVSAFYDVRKDFYAFLSKKCFLMRDLRQDCSCVITLADINRSCLGFL